MNAADPSSRTADTTAAPELAISAIGVGKTYPARGAHPAVDALNLITLRIPRGSLFGLLGPNGAGKSTFINILAGLVLRSTGSVQIWGHDIDRERRAARTAIGVVPQELNMDPFFTPYELLDVQAGYYGVPRGKRRTDELLEILGLTSKARANCRTLSGGQQRRLMIAKALVHSPKVLVLDEPTAGVDVELRQQLYRYIGELKAAGTTILLTTHYLEEAQRLCDTVAIVNRGRLVACDSTAALLARMDHKELVVTIDRDLSEAPPALTPFDAQLANGRRLTFHYGRSEIPIAPILAAIQGAGLSIVDLSTTESDLEDIFLMLTGNGPDAPQA